MRLLVVTLIFLSATSALASYADLNILYFNDQFTTASSATYSRTMYDLSLGYEISKDKKSNLALNFGSATFTEKGTTTTTFTNSDTGIKFIYFFTRSKTWLSSLTYNFIAKAKYNDGTSEVELRGTSIKADFGYNFAIGDYSGIALKLVYYAPSFSESVANSTITTVSYKRTIIYPGLSYIYLF